MKIKIITDEGSLVPSNYHAVAYDDFMSAKVIWYPIGIHWIMRIIKRIRHLWIIFQCNRLGNFSKLDSIILKAKITGKNPLQINEDEIKKPRI